MAISKKIPANVPVVDSKTFKIHPQWDNFFRTFANATLNLNTTTTGIVTQISATETVNRTLTAGLGIAITNGDGVAGNPAISVNNIPQSAVTNLSTDLNNKQPLDPTLTALAAYSTNGMLVQIAADSFTGRTLTGTANQIDVVNGDGVADNPTVSISATYVGQASITTLGTISTGTWNAATLGVLYGGTGQTSYTDGQLLIGNSTGNTLTKSTLTAGPGISITNGSGSITIGSDRGLVKISSVTASNSASVTFTGLSTSYRDFLIVLSNVIPSTDAVNLLLQTSTNNGSSYDAGASDYKWISKVTTDAGTEFNNASTASTSIRIMDALGNSTGENLSGHLTLHSPQTAGYFLATWLVTSLSATPALCMTTGSGIRVTAADVDAIKLTMSSGNIASGTFTLYGYVA